MRMHAHITLAEARLDQIQLAQGTSLKMTVVVCVVLQVSRSLYDD